MRKCLDLNWQPKTMKHAFWVSDAPCHGSKYHVLSEAYDRYIDGGDPTGLVIEDLCKEFETKGIALNLMRLNEFVDKMIGIMKENNNNIKVIDLSDDSLSAAEISDAFTGDTIANMKKTVEEDTKRREAEANKKREAARQKALEEARKRLEE